MACVSLARRSARRKQLQLIFARGFNI